ncbi:hypothetical protein [Bartonella sp. B41]
MLENGKNQPLDNHHAQQNAWPQDHPLDPTVERVRKKLMRLMIISILITLILLLAVLAGIIYKIMATEPIPKQATTSFSSQSQNSVIARHTLFLPEKTQILSQSLSENNIVFKTLTPKGKEKFIIYNYHIGKIVAILSVETKEEAPPPFSN